MTVGQLIEHIDTVLPNKFDFNTKLLWINSVWAKIQTEMLRAGESGVKLYSSEEDEINIPYAYISVYIYYTFAMIYMLCGEFEKYNMSSMAYNSEMSRYAKYVARGGK